MTHINYGPHIIPPGVASVAQTAQTQSLIQAVYDGAASISTGTVRLTNANGVTFTINGQTLSASILQSAPISRYNHNTAALYSSSSGNMINTSVSIAYVPIVEAVAFSRVDIPVSIDVSTQGTTATNAVDISAIGVFYTRNGSTLSPIVGQSSTTTYTWASNTGVYSSLTGPRLLSFNIATTLTAGEYWFAMQLSSHSGSSIGASTTLGSMTIAPIHGTSYTVLPWANISAATASTINTLFPMQGMNSVSIANTTQSHQQSQITQYGATAQSANMILILRNV